MVNRHHSGDLKQLQSLPLEAKIRMTQERIRVWYESWWRFKVENLNTGKIKWRTYDMRGRYEPPLKENEFSIEGYDGSAYVSFSGGKDSTVLADMCAQICAMYGWTLYLLFVNTGLEYPEIQKFVHTFADWLSEKYSIEVVLDVVRPEMRFDAVIKKYGYPVVSKEVSNTISGAKNSIQKGVYSHRLCKLGVKRDEYGGLYDNGEHDYDGALEKSKFRQPQWRFLLDAPFDCSSYCCDVMKKAPASAYERKTGRKPIIATLAVESTNRETAWLKNGCNAFGAKKPKSTPMAFWTEQDVLHYIKKYNVPYCSVYGDIHIKPHGDYLEGQIDAIDYLGCYEPEDTLETTGCDRTGCIFCTFGIKQDGSPNRFQRLKETHPKQYRYCINGGEMVDGKWQPNKEGLGLGKVLDYIGVKYD